MRQLCLGVSVESGKLMVSINEGKVFRKYNSTWFVSAHSFEQKDVEARRPSYTKSNAVDDFR